MSEQDATPGFEPQAKGVDEGPEVVGAADAQADAIRSGADEDVPPDEMVARDFDGEPVGRSDSAADRARSGGDPGD
jgi:hypothetical protein